jgi:hypothetical protein
MQSVIAPWPKGVAAVPEPIQGTAFFPGGYGLWQEGSTTMGAFPTDGVMIVGQDFNSLAAYERARIKGSEIGTSTTWRNLIPILAEAGVPAETCFFTNVYMGLRDGGKETGRFPGSRDHDFVARCSRFFDRQLAVSRPKLILVLGWSLCGIVPIASERHGTGDTYSMRPNLRQCPPGWRFPDGSGRADSSVVLSRKRVAPKVRKSDRVRRGASYD